MLSPKLPSSPRLKYQVSTSWLNWRGPSSIGRLVMKPKFAVPSPQSGDATAHRSMPNGLYGLSAEMLMPSAMPPVPANGPTKIGSGAAWLNDWRLLYSALACSETASLKS